jgi:hypothetical protein
VLRPIEKGAARMGSPLVKIDNGDDQAASFNPIR